MLQIDLLLSYGRITKKGDFHCFDSFTLVENEQINPLLQGLLEEDWDQLTDAKLELVYNDTYKLLATFKKVKVKAKTYKWIVDYGKNI